MDNNERAAYCSRSSPAGWAQGPRALALAFADAERTRAERGSSPRRPRSRTPDRPIKRFIFLLAKYQARPVYASFLSARTRAPTARKGIIKAEYARAGNRPRETTRCVLKQLSFWNITIFFPPFCLVGENFMGFRDVSRMFVGVWGGFNEFECYLQ